eukprot:3026461-Alexandrium_andersonii.AAC.1
MPHGRVAAPMSARPSARAHRRRWGHNTHHGDGRVPAVPPRPMQAGRARGQEPTPARNTRTKYGRLEHRQGGLPGESPPPRMRRAGRRDAP